MVCLQQLVLAQQCGVCRSVQPFAGHLHHVGICNLQPLADQGMGGAIFVVQSLPLKGAFAFKDGYPVHLLSDCLAFTQQYFSSILLASPDSITWRDLSASTTDSQLRGTPSLALPSSQ